MGILSILGERLEMRERNVCQCRCSMFFWFVHKDSKGHGEVDKIFARFAFPQSRPFSYLKVSKSWHQQNLVNIFPVHDFMPPFINHRGGLACSERQCRGPRLHYGNACESQTHTPQRCLWLRYMRFAAGTLQEKMKASERICLIFRCFCIGSCVPWSCHASSCLYAHRDHFDTERQPDDDRNLLLRCQLGGVVAQGAAAEFGRRDGGIQSQCFVQQTRKTTHTIITYNYYTTISLNKFIDFAFLCHFLQGRISPAWWMMNMWICIRSEMAIRKNDGVRKLRKPKLRVMGEAPAKAIKVATRLFWLGASRDHCFFVLDFNLWLQFVAMLIAGCRWDDGWVGSTMSFDLCPTTWTYSFQDPVAWQRSCAPEIFTADHQEKSPTGLPMLWYRFVMMQCCIYFSKVWLEARLLHRWI